MKGDPQNVRRMEGHLFVCKGCCCGNVETGHPAVPLERFKQEWKERGIRKRVHLTISGCLGPCEVANVVLLVFQGAAVWLHSINSDSDVLDVYDYIGELMDQRRFQPPTGPLAAKVFERFITEGNS